MTQIIPYSQIPDPAPIGFCQAVLDAGGWISSAPNGWHVGDPAQVLALYSTYSGSATELAFNKNTTLTALNSIYLGKFGAGFNYTGPDGVKRSFQIDPTSQFNIDVQANASLGSIINGEAWDANSYFIAADNSHMPTPTAQDMRAFSLAVRGYVAQIILRNRALKDQIAAASDMTTLTAIDVTSGWPANP